MTVNQLKSLLSRFHIKPNKLLGQNFLLSEEVLDKIVEAGELDQNDFVLEIGPGLGILTMRLAEEAGKVLAVEKDEKIYQALRKILKRYKNVKLIHKDALFFQPASYQLQATSYKLLANIPYYLTGKIIQNFLTAENQPSLMVLLLQKEVAERLTARPGEMSLLSVSAQFYSDPEIISIVGKGNFYPEPQVDSAIVRLKVLPKPRFGVDEKKFFQLVKIGFAGRRKQLHNNLTSGLGAGDYKKILTEIGLNPLSRAQDLSLDDWHKLYNTLFA
ncbi:MAG: 16S rRNA (adenine(1518)-N(6)/adenine(1519)-N(6))-dimethyltransferase RsmA [Candidatus Doudnabacteria bacterium]|nr:16S rRNA (adenine(1518)-N(6)/adenine(1519)-N(6))-dimethyltransferase RsmA [bacterium]MDZ4243888.1 16S rRNA (adenine(1518)-N(6)/adenine(1519)-N(6))-dimethyltransferase RsmA [Candidatus Doudnabacteria bacterium]